MRICWMLQEGGDKLVIYIALINNHLIYYMLAANILYH